MSEAFQLVITPEEAEYLKDLARWSILQGLKRKALPDESEVDGPPEGSVLRSELGAFVTLKLGGRLRGCIGYIVGQGPLYLTVVRMAQAAAFEDHRFQPLSLDEFSRVDIEISVLSPITPCPDPEAIEIGRHGLIIAKNGRRGLLLPQVPVEWGWDRLTFLDQLCAKAGLKAGEWKQGAELLWFEAVVL